MKKTSLLLAAAAALTLATAPLAMADVDAEKIFKKKCAMCHKIDKKKVGPAFKDMNADVAVLKETITNGRKMMPKFGKKLSGEEIDAMVAFIASKKLKAAANPCTVNPCAAK